MPDKMTIEQRHLKKSPDEVRIWNHQGIFLFYLISLLSSPASL